MEEINQLGGKQSGPIFDALQSYGVTHENYFSSPEKMPEENKIGMGAQNDVYVDPNNPDQVLKYPRLENSTSYNFRNGEMYKIKTTHLDKLIHQYEKILNIRIFNCVVNKAHANFLYFNPDKISDVPFLASTNAQ